MEPVDDFVFTTNIRTPLEAATLLAVQGVHPKTIQAVLEWDQVAMVDRYAHFVDEMRKDAATKMDAILKPVAVRVAVKLAEAKTN